MSSQSLQAFVALLLGTLAVMGSPGPATMSAVAVGVAYGFRRSLRYIAGLMAGTTLVLIGIAVGLLALLYQLPFAHAAVLVLSSGYLFFLAYKIATAPPFGGDGEGAPRPKFAAGFLLGVTNPKAILAFGSLFAGPALVASPAADAAVKFLFLMIMGIIIQLTWLAFGARLSVLLRQPVASRIANVLMGAALAAVAAHALYSGFVH